jgi:hypothetical protein
VTEGDPYNPLDKLNLGRSVAEALLERPVARLSETTGLIGAGVYAIYYTGDFPAYQPIAEQNRSDVFKQPIYVGKAVPTGARKGGVTLDASTGNSLRDRLRIHATSIRGVENLALDDFWFRSLVVDDVWIPLGESMMIALFKPIWNRVIDGFGNNKPGVGRSGQRLSFWDILHPGRKSMRGLPDGGVTPADVEDRLSKYFSGQAVALVPLQESTDSGASEEDNV